MGALTGSQFSSNDSNPYNQIGSNTMSTSVPSPDPSEIPRYLLLPEETGSLITDFLNLRQFTRRVCDYVQVLMDKRQLTTRDIVSLPAYRWTLDLIMSKVQKLHLQLYGRATLELIRSRWAEDKIMAPEDYIQALATYGKDLRIQFQILCIPLMKVNDEGRSEPTSLRDLYIRTEEEPFSQYLQHSAIPTISITLNRGISDYLTNVAKALDGRMADEGDKRSKSTPKKLSDLKRETVGFCSHRLAG